MRAAQGNVRCGAGTVTSHGTGMVMAHESARSLQDTFLSYVQEQSVPVTVFLVSGVRLQGYVTYFDKFGVALTRDHQTQFVYKHAISAINPLTAIHLSSEPGDGGPVSE
jgi:host factor-I protein